MVTKKDRYSGYFSKHETMTASERRQFQNKKLKQIVAYAYEKAPAIGKTGSAKISRPFRPSGQEKLVSREGDLSACRRKIRLRGFNGFLPRAASLSPGPHEPGEMAMTTPRLSLYAGGFQAGISARSPNFHMVPLPYADSP
jgi:hypothetical protein